MKPLEPLNLEASSDSMIALYRSLTKVFEAMTCGIVLITNIRPDLILEIGFGIIVEDGNIDQNTGRYSTLYYDSLF